MRDLKTDDNEKIKFRAAFAERSLLFEPGTHYRYSSYGWILVSAAVETAADEPLIRFMRKQIFEPLGMDDTRADSATEPIADRATFYFPRFAADPRYGLHLMRPIDYSCYAGSSVFLHSVRPRALRHGDQQRQAAATRHGPITADFTATGFGAGDSYGLGWDLETVTLAGEQTRVVGRDGESLGGVVASLMTFPEHGIVMSLTSNISYADTFAVALKIAQAFAEQRKSPAASDAPRAVIRVVLVGKHKLVFDEAVLVNDAEAVLDELGDTVYLDTPGHRELLAKLRAIRWAKKPTAEAANEQEQVAAEPPRVGVLRVLAGPSQRPEYTLEANIALIGASEQALVRLQGWFKPKVAIGIARHDDGYVATPYGGEPQINNQRLRGRHNLKEGDVLDVSGVVLEFRWSN